jgi:hypothetical protein
MRLKNYCKYRLGAVFAPKRYFAFLIVPSGIEILIKFCWAIEILFEFK